MTEKSDPVESAEQEIKLLVAGFASATVIDEIAAERARQISAEGQNVMYGEF